MRRTKKRKPILTKTTKTKINKKVSNINVETDVLNKTEKKTKNPKKKDSKINVGSEVFVLPPHLLAKLGINLENIEEAQTTPEKQELNTYANGQDSTTSASGNNEVSSNVETVNLMKESLFLSPSFGISCDIPEAPSTPIRQDDNEMVIDSTVIHTPAIIESIVKAEQIENTNHFIGKENRKTNIEQDDHKDEAYSSDYSNSNPAFLEEAEAFAVAGLVQFSGFSVESSSLIVKDFSPLIAQTESSIVNPQIDSLHQLSKATTDSKEAEDVLEEFVNEMTSLQVLAHIAEETSIMFDSENTTSPTKDCSVSGANKTSSEVKALLTTEELIQQEQQASAPENLLQEEKDSTGDTEEVHFHDNLNDSESVSLKELEETCFNNQDFEPPLSESLMSNFVIESSIVKCSPQKLRDNSLEEVLIQNEIYVYRPLSPMKSNEDCLDDHIEILSVEKINVESTIDTNVDHGPAIKNDMQVDEAENNMSSSYQEFKVKEKEQTLIEVNLENEINDSLPKNKQKVYVIEVQNSHVQIVPEENVIMESNADILNQDEVLKVHDVKDKLLKNDELLSRPGDQQDKTQEIAALLSAYLIKKKSNRQTVTRERSWISNVERSIIQTYSRLKARSVPEAKKRLSEGCRNVSVSMEIDGSSDVVLQTCERNQCICADFGYLALYGEEDPYEHLHFLERPPSGWEDDNGWRIMCWREEELALAASYTPADNTPVKENVSITEHKPIQSKPEKEGSDTPEDPSYVKETVSELSLFEDTLPLRSFTVEWPPDSIPITHAVQPLTKVDKEKDCNDFKSGKKTNKKGKKKMCPTSHGAPVDDQKDKVKLQATRRTSRIRTSANERNNTTMDSPSSETKKSLRSRSEKEKQSSGSIVTSIRPEPGKDPPDQKYANKDKREKSEKERVPSGKCYDPSNEKGKIPKTNDSMVATQKKLSDNKLSKDSKTTNSKVPQQKNVNAKQCAETSDSKLSTKDAKDKIEHKQNKSKHSPSVVKEPFDKKDSNKGRREKRKQSHYKKSKKFESQPEMKTVDDTTQNEVLANPDTSEIVGEGNLGTVSCVSTDNNKKKQESQISPQTFQKSSDSGLVTTTTVTTTRRSSSRRSHITEKRRSRPSRSHQQSPQPTPQAEEKLQRNTTIKSEKETMGKKLTNIASNEYLHSEEKKKIDAPKEVSKSLPDQTPLEQTSHVKEKIERLKKQESKSKDSKLTPVSQPDSKKQPNPDKTNTSRQEKVGPNRDSPPQKQSKYGNSEAENMEYEIPVIVPESVVDKCVSSETPRRGKKRVAPKSEEKDKEIKKAKNTSASSKKKQSKQSKDTTASSNISSPSLSLNNDDTTEDVTESSKRTKRSTKYQSTLASSIVKIEPSEVVEVSVQNVEYSVVSVEFENPVTPTPRKRGRPPGRSAKNSPLEPKPVPKKPVPKAVRREKDSDNDDDAPLVSRCGACKSGGVGTWPWRAHLRAHSYVAWRAGETPLDMSDETSLLAHLNTCSRAEPGGRLTCSRCGVRLFPKRFLPHLQNCPPPTDVNEAEDAGSADGTVSCGVCEWSGHSAEWRQHALDTHYNVAWKRNDPPIDVNNPRVCERLIKEYGASRKLECLRCGLTRASLLGFYAHVIVCGKTVEECAKYKVTCEDCGTEYLLIYRQQHLAGHRFQLVKQESYTPAPEIDRDDDNVVTPQGKRKAAARARQVIEKYATKLAPDDEDPEDPKEFSESASECERESSSSSEDESEGVSEHESDTPVESDGSDTLRPKRKHKHPPPLAQRLPFGVRDIARYLQSIEADHKQPDAAESAHWSSWQPAWEVTSQQSSSSSSPPVRVRDRWHELAPHTAESLSDGAWCLYGGELDGRPHVSWVPGSDQLLAVFGKCTVHVWHCGNFRATPKLTMIADIKENYVISWCPHPEAHTEKRMGILAAAGEGGAWLYCVPHPDDSSKPLVVSLVAVAELRRSKHQELLATSVVWTKDGLEVLVGYSDGQVAQYRLSGHSPLTDMETCTADVRCYYPHYEERASLAPVIGLDVGGGLTTATGATGTVLVGTGRGGSRSARVVAPQPAAQAPVAHHFPVAVLTGDYNIVSSAPTELQLWGATRRVGAGHAVAHCPRCHVSLAYAAPRLKAFSAHPLHSHLDTQTVATLRVRKLGPERYGLDLQFKDCKDSEDIEWSGALVNARGVAVCPAPSYHSRAALVTRCGVIFILKTH